MICWNSHVQAGFIKGNGTSTICKWFRYRPRGFPGYWNLFFGTLSAARCPRKKIEFSHQIDPTSRKTIAQVHLMEYQYLHHQLSWPNHQTTMGISSIPVASSTQFYSPEKMRSDYPPLLRSDHHLSQSRPPDPAQVRHTSDLASWEIPHIPGFQWEHGYQTTRCACWFIIAINYRLIYLPRTLDIGVVNQPHRKSGAPPGTIICRFLVLKAQRQITVETLPYLGLQHVPNMRHQQLPDWIPKPNRVGVGSSESTFESVVHPTSESCRLLEAYLIWSGAFL